MGESVWVSVCEGVLEKMLLLESKIRLEIILKLATLGKVFFSCSEQLYQSGCPSVGLLSAWVYACIFVYVLGTNVEVKLKYISIFFLGGGYFSK